MKQQIAMKPPIGRQRLVEDQLQHGRRLIGVAERRPTACGAPPNDRSAGGPPAARPAATGLLGRRLLKELVRDWPETGVGAAGGEVEVSENLLDGRGRRLERLGSTCHKLLRRSGLCMSRSAGRAGAMNRPHPNWHCAMRSASILKSHGRWSSGSAKPQMRISERWESDVERLTKQRMAAVCQFGTVAFGHLVDICTSWISQSILTQFRPPRRRRLPPHAASRILRPLVLRHHRLSVACADDRLAGLDLRRVRGTGVVAEHERSDAVAACRAERRRRRHEQAITTTSRSAAFLAGGALGGVVFGALAIGSAARERWSSRS